MYDPQHVLASIDANIWPVLIGFGLDSVFQIWWLTAAVRAAKRDRAYSIPLFCTYFWFSHDFGTVIRFDDWFVVYDHWYLKLFWAVLLCANILELVFLVQVYRYGRQELLPQWSRGAFAALLATGLIFAEVSFEFFMYSFQDPILQMNPTLTMLAYPAFGAALLIRRQSARGQNGTMWWAFTAMTGGFHLITYLWFGEAFRSWQYVLAAVAATAGGAAMALTVTSRSWKWNATNCSNEIALTARGWTNGWHDPGCPVRNDD